MSDLGSLIAAKRASDGLSLREAGEASGVAFSTLGRIENGDEPSLRVDRMIRAWLSGESVILPPPPMTLLDYFAGQALPAIIRMAADHKLEDGPGLTVGERVARESYVAAAAMLTERARLAHLRPINGGAA